MQIPTNNFHTFSFVAIDFETSGRHAHDACAIGMTKIENLEISQTFYSLIRPPSSRIYFTDIHGLKWEDLKDKLTFRELWPAFSAFIKNTNFLIAHNAPFDRKVLYGCCVKFSLATPIIPFLCTLKGSRKTLTLPSNSLDNLCEYFNIDLRHHHAGEDALACAKVFINLVKLGCSIQNMLLKPGKIL